MVDQEHQKSAQDGSRNVEPTCAPSKRGRSPGKDAQSVGQVADAAPQRLDSVNPRITAIVDCRPDLVREQADRVDGLLARGNDPGPLAGVPVTVKINIDRAGPPRPISRAIRKPHRQIQQPCRRQYGAGRCSAAWAQQRANVCHTLVYEQPALWRHTHTQPTRPLLPGGSSGGGAAGVAAGIGHIALGTDIGGSVRYPAYACGVHGLRPGLGRVPFYNASLPEATAGAQLMHVVGPMARTVEDFVLVCLMSAADPRILGRSPRLWKGRLCHFMPHCACDRRGGRSRARSKRLFWMRAAPCRCRMDRGGN